MRLKDKVAIITGGAKGIGKKTALLFAKEGAKVVICDFDETAGKNTLEELKAQGSDASFFKVDVTNRSSVQNMVNEAKAKYGKIDILINNAGITADAFLTKMTEEQWDKVIAVNLKGVFNCSQAVAPIMMEQSSGVILSASSVVGVYGNIGQTNYAATKAGVIGMTKSWARELGKKGVRVNAVAPGFIITDMTAKVPEKVLDLMKSKTPLGRLGYPEDVARAYLFLASDEASYINGQVLGVDGGLII
ncbi:3-oxoacyl-ACP reductase FabG [Thermoanaerobacteraceae bacterium SP2]|jgi:3-oxoacyl-[acyl-carrier protein] reductase|nr:3-oxoacyl-ACP reductase FabG [Thermoanaerobacteraceae bacterium SP2]